MQTRTDKLGKVSLTIEGAWSPKRDYDKLSVVTDGPNYINYVSRIPVPKGTLLTNEKYWIKFSSLAEQIVLDYNAFTSRYGQKLEDIKKDIGDLNKLKTKDKSSTVAAINESLTNKINVVNIFDYITSAKVMPSDADVYIAKQSRLNYIPHSAIIYGEDENDRELVFCMVHKDSRGQMYYVFKMTDDVSGWIFKNAYSIEDVPEYILKHLGELNQANEVNILDYITLGESEHTPPLMPINCNYYTDWSKLIGLPSEFRLPFHQGWYSNQTETGVDIHFVICTTLAEFTSHALGHGDCFITFKLVEDNGQYYWQQDGAYLHDKEYGLGEEIPSWVLEAVGENVAYVFPEVQTVTNLVKDNLIVFDTQKYSSTPVEEIGQYGHYRSDWYKVTPLSTVKIYKYGRLVQYIYVKVGNNIHSVECKYEGDYTFSYTPYTDMEIAVQLNSRTDSVRTTITNPTFDNSKGFLNIADYIDTTTVPFTPKGGFKRSAGYTFTIGAESLLLHSREVIVDHELYLICCSHLYSLFGSSSYIVFKQNSSTQEFVYDNMYSVDDSTDTINVPDWILETFNEGKVNVLGRLARGYDKLPLQTNGYYAALDGIQFKIEHRVNASASKYIFYIPEGVKTLGFAVDTFVYEINDEDLLELKEKYKFENAPDCYKKLFYSNEDVENFVVGSTLFSSAIVETQTEIINYYTIKQTNVLMLDNNYSVVKTTDEEGNEINVLLIK